MERIDTQQVQAILWRAAEILQTAGWLQGAGPDPWGPCCAAQAICRAAGGLGLGGEPVAVDTECYLHVLRYINSDPLKARFTFLSSWNDLPGRTADEVIRTLKEAAQWPSS